MSQDRSKNVIPTNGSRYRIKFHEKNSGHNSFVFCINDLNSTDIPERIIKICKYSLSDGSNRQRLDRFEREIDALKIASAARAGEVVTYYFDGVLNVSGKDFRYFVMEKAFTNLTKYMLRVDMDLSEKTKLCLQILNAIKYLHSLDIYHRDIKPDNILIINDSWKVSDLGLLSRRNEDYDGRNEMIGPAGWLSPEAMNKVLTYGFDTEFEFDCIIDEMSDLFQLGKLFWFIFQGNVPIGQIQQTDFKVNNPDIFEIIKLMLQYDKARRLTLTNIETRFEPIRSALMI